MGQEIVYCSKCAERLMGSDFERGKAFRIGDKSACLKCAREMLPTLSAKEQQELAERFKQLELRKASGFYPSVRPSTSTQVPTVRSSSTQTPSVRSSNPVMPSIKAQIPQRPPESKSSQTPVLIGVVVTAVVLILVAVAMSGRSTPRPVNRDPDPPEIVETTQPTPRPDPRPAPPPPPPDPKPVPRPDPPANPAGEILALDAALAPAFAQGEFRRAWDLITGARARFLDAHWAKEIEIRSKRLDDEVRKAFTPLLAKASEALAKKDDAAVQDLKARVAAWGLPAYIGELDKVLSAAPPPPPPPTAAPPALVKAFLAARGRDFEAASKEAADPADQEAIRLAAQVPQEAFAALAKWTRGWNLAVTVLDAEGNLQKIDEPAVRLEPFRADVRRDRGTQGVEFGEIAPASLADLFRGRAAKKETDARAAAWFCAIEGDLEAAKRHWPEIPERALAAAAKAAGSVDAAREAGARKLFAEAEAEFRAPGSRSTSLPKFQRLLSEFPDTAFVKRNRASIQSRSDGGKEYFYAPGELAGSGLFKPARHADGRVSWTMEDDDKSKKLEAAVELEFGALADAEYRMWIFAGACCQETFAFVVQASDLSGGEPGGPTGVTVPVPISFLKKSHVQHGGRKEPARWDWIPVPIPAKYAAAGPKKVRILSDQQGFSIAYAMVSSLRRTAPKEAEAKELERGRPALQIRGGGGGPVTGTILREWWLGIPGSQVSDLLGSPNYPAKPSGSELITIFEGPTNAADDYGTRIRGYVHPPQNGAYTFWTATDDACDLYFSMSEDPNQKQRIAYQTGAVAKLDWNKEPSQKSNPVQLFKGKRYYIELLHKEGNILDHLAVGWQLPDGTMERPIPGKRLSPWTGGTKGAGVTLQAVSSGAAPAKLDLSGELFGGISASKAEVWSGSTRLGDAKATTLTYTWANVPSGVYPLVLRVTDKSGAVYASPANVVKVGDLFFYRAIDLNGLPSTIDGNPWEGREAQNVVVKGTGFDLSDADLKPPADAERAAMIRTAVTSAEGTSVTLSAVPPATYQVYLTVWGEGDPKTFDLLLKGKVVQPAYASAAGKWDRLGPWTVEVTDGLVDVKASKAGACFSGIELWSVGGSVVVPTQLTPTSFVGGPGGGAFEERPAGTQFLVGFKYTTTAFIKSIQGIYQAGETRRTGEMFGDPQGQPLQEIVAKPGYAVGGLVARSAGFRVDQIKVIFMKISGPRLVPSDSYESPLIGPGAGGETKLVGDGNPVVGLTGRRGGDLDALGLLYLK